MPTLSINTIGVTTDDLAPPPQIDANNAADADDAADEIDGWDALLDEDETAPSPESPEPAADADIGEFFGAADSPQPPAPQGDNDALHLLAESIRWIQEATLRLEAIKARLKATLEPSEPSEPQASEPPANDPANDPDDNDDDDPDDDDDDEEEGKEEEQKESSKNPRRAAAKGLPADEWPRLSITTLVRYGLTRHLCLSLSRKGFPTLRALAIQVSREENENVNKVGFISIKGVGAKTAQKITTALERFWEANPQVTQAATEDREMG